jgi:hypothetical protein
MSWLRRNLAIGNALPFIVVLTSVAFAGPIGIEGVPSYDWYHGCGPTAAASIFGYWDLNGYPNLFDASGDAVYLENNVQDQISSPAHNNKYENYRDDPAVPDPPDTSIADFFQTSENQGVGWSRPSDAVNAFEGYAAYRGYDFQAVQEVGSSVTWDDIVNAINAGQPMLFGVDTQGRGWVDHFVAVIAYDDRGDAGEWYAFMTPFRNSGRFTGSRLTSWQMELCGASMT